MSDASADSGAAPDIVQSDGRAALRALADTVTAPVRLILGYFGEPSGCSGDRFA